MGEGAQFSKDFAEKVEKEIKDNNHRTLSEEELDERFGFRNLPPEQIDDISKVRAKFRDLAWYIDTYIPMSRSKMVALTELEGASHWAIKALAQKTIIEMEDTDARPE